MAHGATIRRSERYLVLGGVLVLHAAALVLLILSRGHSSMPPLKQGALKMVALGAAPPAPMPPPPIPPIQIAQEVVLQLAVLESADEGSNQPAAGTSACTTLDQVRDAVASDPAALSSALNAPPETRSVAEAVVIWNGDWLPSAGSAQAPLGPTRTAVERSVAALSEECLDEPIIGPRLVPFPAGTGTMFLVFGSGSWRWRDVGEDVLLSGPPQQQADQPGLTDRIGNLFDGLVRN